MNEVVAKKYVKAILSDVKSNELNVFVENLSELAAAFASDKFKSIISLPTLKALQKVEFVLSLVKNQDAKFDKASWCKQKTRAYTCDTRRDEDRAIFA